MYLLQPPRLEVALRAAVVAPAGQLFPLQTCRARGKSAVSAIASRATPASAIDAGTKFIAFHDEQCTSEPLAKAQTSYEIPSRVRNNVSYRISANSTISQPRMSDYQKVMYVHAKVWYNPAQRYTVHMPELSHR